MKTEHRTRIGLFARTKQGGDLLEFNVSRSKS